MLFVLVGGGWVGGGGRVNKVYYGLCENGEFSTKMTELVQPCPQGFSGPTFSAGSPNY